MSDDILKDALLKCAEKFALYESHHLAKGDVEKASVNREMQVMIHHAIAAANSVFNEGECRHDLIITKMMDDYNVIRVCSDCGQDFGGS